MIEVDNLSKAYGPDPGAGRRQCPRSPPAKSWGCWAPTAPARPRSSRSSPASSSRIPAPSSSTGWTCRTHLQEVQARIGYLPENAPLYPELSVQGYLQMMADLRQIPRSEQTRAPLGGDPRRQPHRPADAAHRHAEQGLPPARGAGPGHPAPAAPADPRRALRRPGPDADRGDAQSDPAAGRAEHDPLLDPHPLRGRGALRPRAVILMNGRGARRCPSGRPGASRAMRVLVLETPVDAAPAALRALPGVRSRRTMSQGIWPSGLSHAYRRSRGPTSAPPSTPWRRAAVARARTARRSRRRSRSVFNKLAA